MLPQGTRLTLKAQVQDAGRTFRIDELVGSTTTRWALYKPATATATPPPTEAETPTPTAAAAAKSGEVLYELQPDALMRLEQHLQWKLQDSAPCAYHTGGCGCTIACAPSISYIEYKDDEGDHVMLQGLEDLRSALEVQKLNPVRLLLTLQPTPTGVGEPEPILSRPNRASSKPNPSAAAAATNTAAKAAPPESTETESEPSKGVEERTTYKEHDHHKHHHEKNRAHEQAHYRDHDTHGAHQKHDRGQHHSSDGVTPTDMIATSKQNDPPPTTGELDQHVQVSRSTTGVGPPMFKGAQDSPTDPDAAAAAAALLFAGSDVHAFKFSSGRRKLPLRETQVHDLSEEDGGGADGNSSLAGHKRKKYNRLRRGWQFYPCQLCQGQHTHMTCKVCLKSFHVECLTATLCKLGPAEVADIAKDTLKSAKQPVIYAFKGQLESNLEQYHKVQRESTGQPLETVANMAKVLAQMAQASAKERLEWQCYHCQRGEFFCAVCGKKGEYHEPVSYMGRKKRKEIAAATAAANDGKGGTTGETDEENTIDMTTCKPVASQTTLVVKDMLRYSLRKCLTGCGRMLHIDCVPKHSLTTVRTGKRTGSLVTFSCPQHRCHFCFETGSSRRTLKCLFCLTAYHVKCLDSGKIKGVRVIDDKYMVCDLHPPDFKPPEPFEHGVPPPIPKELRGKGHEDMPNPCGEERSHHQTRASIGMSKSADHAMDNRNTDTIDKAKELQGQRDRQSVDVSVPV